jgi:hypothetical protein
LLAPCLLPAADKTWKAGIAKAEITPDKPMWLAGYAARTRPSEGVHHPLWIKVLALETPSGERAVVLTSDLLGLPGATAARIIRELQEKYRLERSRVMLSSSHTHSAPVLSEALFDIYPIDQAQWTVIDEYSRRLERKIVDTIGQALSRMAPAKLYAAHGTSPFAVNRRNNREADLPALLEKGLEPKGPVDHAVPVLAIRGTRGALIGVLFGYACHATTLDSYVWSGDYPGVAQQKLEASYPGATALFYAGAGADQNPMPRRSVELCEKYGTMLAGAVKDVLGREMKPLAPQLQTSFELVTLGFEGNPTREELQHIEASPSATAYRKRWASRLLRSLEKGEKLDRAYPYPVQVWLLGGQQLWIALGGEVVVDYALRFKREFGPETWVAAYSNDVMAYIPSARVQAEGGYESSSMDVYGLAGTGWARDVEERIAAAVIRLVRKTGKSF